MKKISFLVALLCASMISFAALNQSAYYNPGGSEGDIDSEYCGQVMSSGNTEAAFTWETTNEGAIVITISETLGGADNATHFRGDGISLNKFKVGEGQEDASLYFTHSCGGSQQVTLTPIENQAPALGTKIYVNAIIEYATSKDGNAWPTLQFEYTYGGVCNIVPVLTKIVVSAASIYAQVGEGVAITAQGKDQMNQNMDVDIEFSVSPADAGSIENGIFTFAKAGAATITATSGDVEGSVTIYGVPSANLALSQACEGGYYDNNPAESFDKANDGDANTAWVTYADRPATEEWWYVDLGDKYTLAAIDVLWGDPASSSYILQVRDEAPTDEQKADDAAWETLVTVNEAGINSEQFNVVTGEGRYVRLRSLTKTANFLRLKEVRVFGTEYVPGGDDEAPVMVSATLESKTWNSAVIAVSATDNNEVTKYHVVDATNAIDVKLTPTDGKITVSGLSASTAYKFTITALDASKNESANSIDVEVTTDAHAIVPAAPATAPTWPANQVKSIFSDAYPFAPASLNSYNEGWWNAPTLTIDTVDGDSYLHYNLYRDGMIGAQFAEVSVALMEKIHIDVFSSADGSVTFRPIIAGDTEAQNNVKQTLTLVGGQWNSFDFDMSDFGEHNWTRVFQYAIEGYQAGGLVGEHISVDNIYFYRTTPIEDDEAPTNVSGRTESEDYFSATLALAAEDNMGSVLFIVKLGEDTVATGGGLSADTVLVTVKNLLPDAAYTFTVIATDDAGNAADAIEVSAHTKAAPAPAPAPTYEAEKVQGVFTDIYTDLNIGIQGWYAEPAISIGLLSASSEAICITPNATPSSCFGLAFLATDITAYNALEMDVYPTAEDAVLDIQVIGVGEGSTPYNLTANQWNHISLSIADNTKTNCEQIGFYNCNNLKGVAFVQNVLFVTTSSEGIEDVEAGVKAVKVIENGQLIIIKNGVRYTLMGAELR